MKQPTVRQRTVRRLTAILAVLLLVLTATPARAAASPQERPAASASVSQDAARDPAAGAQSGAQFVLAPPTSDDGLPSIQLQIGGGKKDPKSVGGAIEIVLLMTALTMLPAIVMTLTSFTRIVIVFAFMRRAMSVGDLPPNLVVTGLAFFLSLFIMRPVLEDLNTQALKPYTEEKISFTQATDVAAGVMTKFLLKQTREKDLALILELAGKNAPRSRAEVPFLMVVPAFALSEVKTAFEMGFVIFLPFLVIDLVVSCILISMGMFTLPPVMISTPFKLLLFVLVDGWNLLIKSLVQSFA